MLFVCARSLKPNCPVTWGLDPIGRNQGQTEEVTSRMACVMTVQEGEPVEVRMRKVPDLYKDDLAKRRIQSCLGPQREAPSFIIPSNITEADLKTWERLQVSGKTRCVKFAPVSHILYLSRSQVLILDHFLFKKMPLKTQSSWY